MRWRRVVSALGLAAALPLSSALAPVAGQSATAAQPADTPPASTLKADVTALLEQYTLALESLDADAVKKVQPSVDANSLKNAFRQMRSLEVEIDTIDVLSATNTTARVSCRVKQTLEPRAGSKQATTVTRVLRLRRPQSTWIIEAFER